MFSVSVRDHFMIAHSFKGAVFGPAQRLHGAQNLRRPPDIDDDSVGVECGPEERDIDDIGRAVLAEFNFRNLDEAPEFRSRNTTTEFLAKTVFDRMAARIKSGDMGRNAQGIASMRVTLRESHIACASYEARLPTAGETEA